MVIEGKKSLGNRKARARVGRLRVGSPGIGRGPRDGRLKEGIPKGGGKGIDGKLRLGKDTLISKSKSPKSEDMLGNEGKPILGMPSGGGNGIFGKLKFGKPGKPGNPGRDKPNLKAKGGIIKSGSLGRPGSLKPGITIEGGNGISGRPGIGILAGYRKTVTGPYLPVTTVKIAAIRPNYLSF